jgi:hypothetical protein
MVRKTRFDADLVREITKLRLDWESLKASFRRKFRVDQLRDDGGRFAYEGNLSNKPSLAAMSKRAKCEAQWLTDIVICRIVRKRACYSQAMVRLVACEKNQTIPPLTF